MNFQKQVRTLSFEQLDSRIALNGDMNPFSGMEYGRVVARVNQGRSESPGIHRSPFEFNQANPYGELHALQPQHEVNRMRGLPKSRAEGEFPSFHPIPIPSIPAITHQESSVPSITITLVEPLATRPSFSVQVSRPIEFSLVPVDRAESASSSVSARQIGSNESLLLGNQTQKANLNEAELGPHATPSPLPNLAPSTSISSIGIVRSQNQIAISSVVSQKEIAIGNSDSESNHRFGSSIPLKRFESTKIQLNGMVDFSLSLTKNQAQSNEYSNGRSRACVDQAILAENERLNLKFADISGKLPTPKGMIEVRDIPEATRLPVKVYRASNSPFEVLQLVFGSNHLIQDSSESLSSTSEFSETPELATREDSILALAVGTLFAIAIRQKRNGDTVSNRSLGVSKWRRTNR